MADITAQDFKTFDIINPKQNAITCCGKNTWIWCVGGRPEQAVFYVGRRGRYRSLQGNSNKKIAQSIKPKMENISLVFVKTFFKPWED